MIRAVEMPRLFVMVIVLVGLTACNTPARWDREQYNPMRLAELPPAVRATIERETRGASTLEIERMIEDGAIVYEVEVLGREDSAEFLVAEDGSFLGPRIRSYSSE